MRNRIRACAALALALLAAAWLMAYGAVWRAAGRMEAGGEEAAPLIAAIPAGAEAQITISVPRPEPTGAAAEQDGAREAGAGLMPAMPIYDAGAEQQAGGGAGLDKPAWTTLRCRIYHYCECERCTGKRPGQEGYGVTATGTCAKAGRTVAVDPAVIPTGSEVEINGVSYIAEDTGVTGNAVDIFVGNHEQAVRMGTYETEVRWR